MENEKEAMLFWKLAPGDVNKAMLDQDPNPSKDTVATAESWHDLKGLPENIGRISTNITVIAEDMATIRLGHIPEVMEDHWFMYCDAGTIRYFRSWTGICIFEADYSGNDEDGYVITEVRVNLECADVPYMGPMAAGHLFMALLAAEVGAPWMPLWAEFESNLEKGE